MEAAGSAIAFSPAPRLYLPENSDISRYLHQFHLSVRQNSSTNRRGRDDRNLEEPARDRHRFCIYMWKSIFALIACVQGSWEQARDNVVDW
jgi:hypothetical protein